MKSKEQIKERLKEREQELFAMRKRYSVMNPEYRHFIAMIANKMKKKASEVQQAFDVKIQMLQIDIRNLESCLSMDEALIVDLLKKERLEGDLARKRWDAKSKPVYDAAMRIIKHTPGFLLGLRDKTGFDGALEFHRSFFNKMSLRIEEDLEWVLADG